MTSNNAKRDIAMPLTVPVQRLRAWQSWAISVVNKAVHDGQLEPVSMFQCVDCDAPATKYDHRDYAKELDVEPTCHTCNLHRGPAIISEPGLPPCYEVMEEYSSTSLTIYAKRRRIRIKW
jgi:hypothetical protein